MRRRSSPTSGLSRRARWRGRPRGHLRASGGRAPAGGQCGGERAGDWAGVASDGVLLAGRLRQRINSCTRIMTATSTPTFTTCGAQVGRASTDACWRTVMSMVVSEELFHMPLNGHAAPAPLLATLHTGTDHSWWLDATGGHAFSRDGWTWTYTGVARGDALARYNTAEGQGACIHFDDGSSQLFTRLERPHLVFASKQVWSRSRRAARRAHGPQRRATLTCILVDPVDVMGDDGVPFLVLRSSSAIRSTSRMRRNMAWALTQALAQTTTTRRTRW